MKIVCEYWTTNSNFDGLCTKTNSRVSGGYCVRICKKTTTTYIEYKQQLKSAMEQTKIPIKQKPKTPTKTQMMLHFAKAMTKWVSKGLPIVSKETYIDRRTICTDCHDGSSCPICGCKLWAKVALETEKCPNGLW